MCFCNRLRGRLCDNRQHTATAFLHAAVLVNRCAFFDLQSVYHTFLEKSNIEYRLPDFWEEVVQVCQNACKKIDFMIQ